jgi:two-component system phosphate regulon sensor histidine kinase PhoR
MIMSQDSHTQSPISQIGDMLDDGLILTNLDGVIRSANPAAVRWFGENLTGQMIFDVINHPNIGDLFAKAADGAKRCEMRYEPTNIIQREFRMRLQRIGDQSVALLFLDMTLQRNLEKVRRDFVANVSHELRSPLTSLAGFVETMLSDGSVSWRRSGGAWAKGISAFVGLD